MHGIRLDDGLTSDAFAVKILQSHSISAPCPHRHRASTAPATAFARSASAHAATGRAPARAGSAHRGGLGAGQAVVRQARPAAAARTPGAAARPGRAVAGAVVDGRLAAWTTTTRTSSVPGGGVISGIGIISGTRCVIMVNDAGIDAGAIQRMGGDKILRAQAIAMENKLPFVQLIESAGANLLQYKVEGFINGGRLFYNLARLSAAGIPVIGLVHGSSTAGGAYMPGLSDYVIMVRGRAKAFLAGPPLLKAATGEIANDEELGGAEMHTSVSGLGEYLAEDDADALRIARELIAAAAVGRHRAAEPDRRRPGARAAVRRRRAGRRDAAGLPHSRSTCARSSRASSTVRSSPNSAPTTAPATRRAAMPRLYGQPIGIITNNGPHRPGRRQQGHALHPAAAARPASPLLYLQNTTGYIVGKASEQAGMIKHGSKMIQAVTNATVPQHHADVRRQLRRRQLRHVRPRLRPALRVQLAQRPHRGDGRRAGRTAPCASSPRAAPSARACRWTRQQLQRAGEEDHPQLRQPVRRLLHQRPPARRRRHRPARHAPGARPVPSTSAARPKRANCRPMQFGVARP